MPIASPIPRSIAALCAVGASLAAAQANLQEANQISAAQSALPSQGTAAIRFNPAAASEGGLGSAHSALVQTVSGKAGRSYWQLAGTLPQGSSLPVAVSAGLGGLSRESRIDASTSTYAEWDLVPTLALSHRREEGLLALAAVGLSLPFYAMNAYNVVESYANGMDLGALAAFRAAGSTLRVGAAWRHALAPEFDLPMQGSYEMPGLILLSSGWTSPGRRLWTYWEGFVDLADDREGPRPDPFGLGGWEIEARPIPRVPWLGFKYERVRDGSLNAFGFALHPILFERVRLGWETAIGHGDLGHPEALDWLLGEPGENGLGFHWSMSFGLEVL